MAIAEIVKAAEIVKSLATLVKGMKDNAAKVEFQNQIMDLQSAIIAARQENANLHQHVTDLKAQLQAKQDKGELKTQFELKGNAYWRNETPHCVNCMEGGEARTLVRPSTSSSAADCPHCKRRYNDVFQDESPASPFGVSGRQDMDPYEQ